MIYGDFTTTLISSLLTASKDPSNMGFLYYIYGLPQEEKKYFQEEISRTGLLF